MIKIFQYECRRLLWNKFFLGFLLVLPFYGWQVLNRVTILGVSHTAPFSSWSFGDYLSRMLPLLWIGTLFFLTFFTSGKARRVTILTDAAPMSRRRYALARSAAALVGTGMISLACLAEAAVFYVRYFGFVRLELLYPALVILPPALVFALGSGWLLGRYRGWMLYVWMLAPLLCMVLPLPDCLSVWNGSFFHQYPLMLGTLDPAFSLPWPILFVQGILLFLGIGLLLVCPQKLPFSTKTSPLYDTLSCGGGYDAKKDSSDRR